MNRSFVDIDTADQVDKYIDEICSDPVFLCNNKQMCGKNTSIYTGVKNVNIICDDISKANECENDFQECVVLANNTFGETQKYISTSFINIIIPIPNAFDLNGNNSVGTWSNLNITSNSNMTVSFTINIQSTNSNWRNIFHITNTNSNCCNYGNRVPSIWVTYDQTSLLIVNDLQNAPNSVFFTNSLPLNTPTNVTIIWQGQNVSVYFNQQLTNTINFPYPLIEALPSANVYISQSWNNVYATGGFTIQDLTFYNSSLLPSSNSILNSSQSTWKYIPSIGNLINLSGNNIVTNWSNLNITSNSTMSVSFTININSTNSNWRNIFHITNTNSDCCSIGDRVPSVWISASNQTSLLIVNDLQNAPNSYFFTNSLTLNNPTKVDIIWQGQNVKVYFNGLLNIQYNYTNELIPVNANANVYIADQWYTVGGFTIQDFTFYNGPSLTFQTSTNTLSSSTFKYAPSEGNFVELSGNNVVTNWANLNIESNSNMSVSFTINIQNINSNFRNIFHVTNTNNDCCNIGDRVPAVWITAGAQTLLIINSITNNGNAANNSNPIQLNTDTKVDIVWKGQNVKIYFNGILNSQYDYPSPLAPTDPDANVYIADGWYSTGGFTIKDFTFYNGPSIQPPSSTQVYNYLGCYNDTGNRAIPNYVGNVNNQQECQDYAISNNAALYGVQDYGQCFIGNDINQAIQYGSTSNCPDMGGAWTNQLYSTVPIPKITYNYVGCYKDSGNRAIANQMNNVTSIYYCEQLAKESDYSVYGLQDGGKCFVSNDINAAREYGLQTDQSQCGILGGSLTNQVYTNINPIPNLTNITPNMPQSIDNYIYKGCYNNNNNTAIPNPRGTVTSLDQCAKIAEDNREYIFGVTNNGECFTGNDANLALSQGENTAYAYWTTLGSSNTYQVYIRNEETNPLPPPDIKLSKNNFSGVTKIESFSNLNDINNPKYLYSLKILSIILIIILLIYMMYHII